MADEFRWLDAILGDTADGLYVVDHLHRIVRWNDGARRLLGYTAEEVLNRRCHEIVAGCARDGTPVCGPGCAVHACIRRGEPPKSMELQVRTKGGREAWLHVSVIVIPHEPSPLVAHLFHDISLGRRAADAMSRVASLVQTNGALSEHGDQASRGAHEDEGSPGPATAASQLTPREREILRSLADGLSNDDIAARLGVSTFTVRSHVRHILEKAGVHSRAEAVAFAFRNGLVW